MKATRCLTATMLEVGMRYDTELVFSHAQVARYCELADDRNAIHRDPEAARLRFGGLHDIVVPGGLIQIMITGLFGSVLPGDGSLGLTFAPERIRKPVCPGEPITVSVEVSRIRGAMVDFDIAIRDAGGAQIGKAKARVVAPDETYRQWWLERCAATAEGG